ncbi:MAG TPA: hypothetical protein VGK36_12780 [Candidatus Angelobacter sp.]|jgi:uncharacterized protein YfbU (UPF0304 family)
MSAPALTSGPVEKLPDISQAPESERYKLLVDFYKMRIQEYCDRYESMRNLEWKMLFQVYAGYTAIAVTYRYVQSGSENFDHQWISWLGFAGTLIFYLAGRYLVYRIQERMMKFEETREAYLAEMEESFHLHKAFPGTDGLGHQFYWTHRVQLILSTLTFAGLMAYELAKGSGLHRGAFSVVILTIIFLSLFFGLHRVPFKSYKDLSCVHYFQKKSQRSRDEK